MIREEFNDCSEPLRPASKAPKAPNKMGPWVPFAVVVFGGLGVAHIAGLTKPLATMALQLTGLSSHAPGWRLVGDWESDNDPVSRRICYPAPKEGYSGTGVYRADAGRGMNEVLFKITSEDRSGSHVEVAEYVLETKTNYRVRYSIAEDGKSMTREYEGRNGSPISSQYRYLGPPTEDPPIRHLPE